MKILQCIEKSPKSIKDISYETNLYFSDVYRITGVLAKHDLLTLSGIILPHGKYHLFQSKFDLDFVEKRLQEIFPEGKQIEF